MATEDTNRPLAPIDPTDPAINADRLPPNKVETHPRTEAYEPVDDIRQLSYMSLAELDDLFRASPAGEMPDGQADGVAIILAGTVWGRVLATIARWFFWQGKVFDRAAGYLKNRITVVGVKGIKAKVYKDASWFDGKECIALDYSNTSFVAKKIRDEIRQVGDGVYLGVVFWGKKRIADFALDFKRKRLARKAVNFPRLALVLLILSALYGVWRINRNVPVTYASAEDHFKYGSTGGEVASGIPYAVWKALPDLFRDKLPDKTYRPGKEYASFGFIYEDGRDLPVGVSKRNVQGLDRVFLNCAVCHAGTTRDSPGSPPRVHLATAANTIDLGGFQNFLAACAKDPRFNPNRVMAQIRAQGGGGLDLINRVALTYYGIYAIRDRLIELDDMFAFVRREPEFGPGRFDTFNPPKALLRFPMDKLPEREWVGTCDFPSIWNQGKRAGMQLHWDGNNTSVEERNRSASFGTGAIPPTLDRPAMKRIEDWLATRGPDAFPYPVNASLAAKGKPLYEQYCAACHGKSGTDFTGEFVGKVVPIDQIKTDRHRLDSYTEELCAAQNTLFAGYDGERFSHFRKTQGYANAPLDGVWLRAPYLHNGSVPTLRDLLEPADKRPKSFYRGNDVYDPKKVGFVSNVPESDGRKFFLLETVDKSGKPIPGNGNFGHEGKAYGTELAADEKDAIVEYLKGF